MDRYERRAISRKFAIRAFDVSAAAFTDTPAR
jgi:hypothetical protein